MTEPGSSTRIHPVRDHRPRDEVPLTASSPVRQSSSPVERSSATTAPGVCCSPTVATSARSPSTVTAPAIGAPEVLRPSELPRRELDGGDVTAEVADIGGGLVGRDRGADDVLEGDGRRPYRLSRSGDRSRRGGSRSSPSSPGRAEGDAVEDAVGDAVVAGPRSPNPSANTTTGPSGPDPIAGATDGPRSRGAVKTSEPSSPSKPRTSCGPTTTMVPSSATIGDESPPGHVRIVDRRSRSWRQATSSGAEGPSDRPSCDGPPWNWGHSASATSGMPSTTARVHPARVVERRGTRERWAARKARHPSRSPARGCLRTPAARVG